MFINLYDVISVESGELTISAKVSDLEEDFRGEQLRISGSEPFDIHIVHTDKDIVRLDCRVSLKVIRTCSRCLENVDCIYDLSIDRRINVKKHEVYIDDTSEADEISYIEDCNLDVDRLILDELFTVIPMNVLCKEDCKGICKVCGTNLNKSTCDCDQTVPDPRMAVFSDIFNQFKEV